MKEAQAQALQAKINQEAIDKAILEIKEEVKSEAMEKLEAFINQALRIVKD